MPIATVVGMYLLVHLVSRFMIGFSLVFWGVFLSSIVVPRKDLPLARRAVLCGLAVFAVYVLPGLAHYLASSPPNLIERELLVAEAMPHYGVQPGDSVGLIGNGQVASWAHWAQVSVTAEVSSMDADSFWSASDEQQRAAVRAMGESGAKAVVWVRDGNRPCPQDWEPLPGNSGCILSLKSGSGAG